MSVSSNHEKVIPRPVAPNWSKLVSLARTAFQNHAYEETLTHCSIALQATHLRPDSEAALRCLMAEALENLARFSEAVQVLSAYEEEPNRATLSPALQNQVCLRLGSAYGETSQFSQAMTYARHSLMLAQHSNDPMALSRSYLLLGTLHRYLGDLSAARNHFVKISQTALSQGARSLLSQAYIGLGIVNLLESEFADARQAFEQALRVLGTAEEFPTRVSIAINLATVATRQGQLRESVSLLENALPQVERTRNPRWLADAYAHLGYSLLRLGAPQRAEAFLQQALAQTRTCEAALIEARTMETLGELRFLQGNFAEAEQLLTHSLSDLKKIRADFNYATALLTMGCGALLANDAARALTTLQESLSRCERLGNLDGSVKAQLCLVEAQLAMGDLPAAQNLLSTVTSKVESLNTNELVGQLREVSGLVALASQQENAALRYFNQAISIREVMGDRYRQATASYHLGRAHALRGETTGAEKAFRTAHTILTELKARPMLRLVEKAQRELPAQAIPDRLHLEAAEQIIAVVTRLIEAEFSREVLLHEFVRILHEELGLAPVVLFHETPNRELTTIVSLACDQEQALVLAQRLARQEINAQEARVYRLVEKNEIMWLYAGKKTKAVPDALLELLIKQFQSGLERSRHPASESLPAITTMLEPHPLAVPGLVYCSEAMKKVIDQIRRLRGSDITVLITGETGTGKELVARAIHTFSKRAAHPFIPFNCASSPRELIESQLFGHRRGAFTGATADFPGMIGAAEKGTLFLDEVGELAREMQPKLLRFLQNGELQRIGETTPRIMNVRVVAATNRNLEEMVAAGTFRSDLFYRLNVIQFYLPSLRERREEIPLLAEHFLALYMEQTEKRNITLSAEVMSLLKQYHWPGNARQLENELQRLVALAPDDTKITADLLSPHIRNHTKLHLITPLPATSSQPTLAEAIAETERQVIGNAVAQHKGNITKVAAELGVSRYGLRKMLRRHQILPHRKAS